MDFTKFPPHPTRLPPKQSIVISVYLPYNSTLFFTQLKYLATYLR